jgi:replicative DNA helicase
MDEVFNNEVEVAIIGLLLTDGYAIYDVATKIKSYKFSSMPHQIIYKAIEEIVEGGQDPNYLLIKSKLIDKNQLDLAGGVPYLDMLASHHNKIRMLSELVSRLNSAYKTRVLLTINSSIPRYIETSGHVDEVITKLNKDLNNLISDADQPDVILVGDVIDDAFNTIVKKSENPGINGISTGFKEVDFYTGGFLGGELWYIGARPSHGKSAWLIKAAMNVAKNGTGIILFNREMSTESIKERMFSIASGVPLQNIRRGELDDNQLARLKLARDRLRELPIYLDSNFTGEVDYVVSTIRKYHQLHKIQIAGIDYIQIMVERTGESVHLLGNASRQLKLLSNELGITTIVLSQMNRNVELREDKRPMMSDLRQSGNLEEDADLMVAFYRDEIYNTHSPSGGKMEFIIRKARNGPIGTVVLNFDDETVNLCDDTFHDPWKMEGFI